MKLLVILLLINYSSQACIFQDCQCASKNQKDLYVYCSSLSKWPMRHGNAKIDILSLNGNNFTTIPDNVFNGLNIQYLTLSFNNLTKLSLNVFRNLTGLKKLRLLEPSFEDIDVGALEPLKSSLVNLEVFKLKNIKLDRFMNDVRQLTNLRSISLIDMSIAAFSHEWIQNFPALESLSLASNALQTLPDNLFVESTRKLRVLDLTGNLISNLAEVLTALAPVRTVLEELNLGQNRIEFMPDFEGFPKLRVLDLSHNRIQILGSGHMRDLSSLQHAYFAWNAIKQIDNSSFDNLQNLLYLDLSGMYVFVYCYTKYNVKLLN